MGVTYLLTNSKIDDQKNIQTMSSSFPYKIYYHLKMSFIILSIKTVNNNVHLDTLTSSVVMSVTCN